MVEFGPIRVGAGRSWSGPACVRPRQVVESQEGSESLWDTSRCTEAIRA